MEPRRRILRSVALVSSIVFVGGFICWGAGVVVFMGGSKSNPVFQPVPTKGPVLNAPPTKDANGAKSTLSAGGSDPKPVDRTPPPATAPSGSGE
jgi:hypothetical protein